MKILLTNDRNSEIMLYADHDEDEKYGNGGIGYGWGSGGSPENFAYWMETWNYTEMEAIAASGGKINPVQREAVQGLGCLYYPNSSADSLNCLFFSDF